MVARPGGGEGVDGNAPGMLEAGEEKASEDRGDFWRRTGLRCGVIGGGRRSLRGGSGGVGDAIAVPAARGEGVGRGPN